MSVVIIGGHERMETQYKEICKRYHCKVKVFTKMKTDLNHKIGNPDLMILFTATVSHKMVRCAVAESEHNNTILERSHSSSASALINILETYVRG
ncbi:DUF2325 domain-containing protein [Lachnospiraceae bacterium]|jgi:hypothetical protein|nr:DUF2325 domain-containing protein [uncultured Schaedlerella sp.]EOS39202.1 hypothetical protein C808_02057 [Lachnospiraceae bacterium M18-1]MCI9153748.1 DUF2325 domain-containing protein [Ruminococcus sp.]NBI60065.1 DUF2325 domain-containing protein [Lachnospiraceae bacterium]